MRTSFRSARVRRLVRDLDHARRLADDIARARESARAITRVYDREFGLDGASSLASGLADDIARARESARDLTRVSDLLPRALVHDLTRDLANAHDVAYGLADDIARARESARAITRVYDLDNALTRALTRVSGLPTVHISGLTRDRARGKQRRPAPLAGRLLAAAARMLPAGDRLRYAEEFRSELWEIAAAGQPRRSQLRYAARCAVSSLRLRKELRAPRRKGATP